MLFEGLCDEVRGGCCVVMGISTGSFERGVLRLDAVEQILPGCDERRGAFALKIGCEFFIVDAGLGKRGDHAFGIAAILRQDLTQCAVIGERQQRLLGNRIDGVRRSQRLDVKDIGGLGIFGAGARPKQALRRSAGTGSFLPAW